MKEKNILDLNVKQSVALCVTANTTPSTPGNVGIGLGSTLPSYKLHVQDNVQNSYATKIENTFTSGYAHGLLVRACSSAYPYEDYSYIIKAQNAAGADRFYVTSAGDTYGYAWHSTSDIRYKKDISKLNIGLDTILLIDPIQFKFIDKNNINFGVSAQDLQKIIPELVSSNSEGKLFVNYDGIIPILVNSVKDLNAKIEEKNSRIDELEKRLERLEKMLFV